VNPESTPAQASAANNNHANNSVRRTLVKGVFWRILLIEMILLVWSLGYRAATEDAAFIDLFWFAIRILILVTIIIAFVTLSLRSFLQQKIITPLEIISRANLKLDTEAPVVNNVELPAGTPVEITDIVETRQRMLVKILKVSSERLRLVNFIRDTFGRYVSKKVVDEILASPDGHKIGGRRKTVTILMADLRGFTSITETSDPEMTVRLLNRFFGAMAKIITAYDGLIDEFLGDGILTIFGVPERHPDDPARAVACALEMQNALRKLNKEFTREGFPPLEMGIGINTGSVIVGNIGSDIRSKYGIIGVPVNTASRIESITTGGQVFIGEPTYRLVESGVQVEKPHTVMMKGLKKPLICFPVKAIYSPYQVKLKTIEKKSRQIELQLAFTCWQLDGKKVMEPAMAGQTLAVAEDIWQVAVTPPLEPLTDIKVQLNFCAEAHCFEAIYAKVLETESRESDTINRLRITGIQPDDRKIISQWTESVEAR
jgi:class 3 adenylate cyclase